MIAERRQYRMDPQQGAAFDACECRAAAGSWRPDQPRTTMTRCCATMCPAGWCTRVASAGRNTV